jgi:hypothetical protein
VKEATRGGRRSATQCGEERARGGHFKKDWAVTSAKGYLEVKHNKEM